MELKGKLCCKVGKYTCRCSYKIVGLTDSAIEDFNRLLAKEEQNDDKRTGYGVCDDSMLP